MIMNGLCIGVICLASLFSAVKNYFALPPPQQIVSQDHTDEKQKGTKICKGHVCSICWEDNQKGFETAKNRKQYFDESLPYDKSIKSFHTEIFKDERSGWGFRISYAHTNNCAQCDEFDLVDEAVVAVQEANQQDQK